MKTYDTVPQNVNFAIRGEIAEPFLAQNGVDPVLEPAGAPLPPEELAEGAQAFTRLVNRNRKSAPEGALWQESRRDPGPRAGRISRRSSRFP